MESKVARRDRASPRIAELEKSVEDLQAVIKGYNDNRVRLEESLARERDANRRLTDSLDAALARKQSAERELAEGLAAARATEGDLRRRLAGEREDKAVLGARIDYLFADLHAARGALAEQALELADLRKQIRDCEHDDEEGEARRAARLPQPAAS